MVKLKILVCLPLFLWCLGLLDHGASGADTDRVSVLEGDSVTLNTGVQTNQQDSIRWYYNDIRIAQISGDQSKICTDVQCKDGDERFRDRLKLDHQTGSLTIMNITDTDSGLYHLKIGSGSSDSEKIFSVSVHGASGADTDRVSVMEGDSVTLHTGVQTNQQDRVRWYYNDIRIAQISGDQSKICTDVQCNEGTERFRDRLKLDHQTGSLTIMNITDTDSGLYHLKIGSGSSDTEKIFSVSVHGVSAAEREEMKRKTVKEGESVTLYTSVGRKQTDLITWYFNDIHIAEITGEQRKKLDHQTGSLIITNTRITDSGEYKLQINSSRFSITRHFSVSVTAVAGSGLSSAAIGGIIVAVVILFVVAAAGIYYHHKKQKGNRTLRDDHPQENGVAEAVPLNQRTETETAVMENNNGIS
ncbi:unnamed protein product [Leuciscus chuanchicus]